MRDFLNLPIAEAVEAADPFVSETFPAEPCRLATCEHDRVFRSGQPYVRFEGSFVHTGCLDSLVKSLAPDDFLMLLASHVAIAPSNHNAGTIRQVINGLRKQLGALQLEREQAVADAYARGAKDTAEAVAEQVHGP